MLRAPRAAVLAEMDDGVNFPVASSPVAATPRYARAPPRRLALSDDPGAAVAGEEPSPRGTPHHSVDVARTPRSPMRSPRGDNAPASRAGSFAAPRLSRRSSATQPQPATPRRLLEESGFEKNQRGRAGVPSSASPEAGAARGGAASRLLPGAAVVVLVLVAAACGGVFAQSLPPLVARLVRHRAVPDPSGPAPPALGATADAHARRRLIVGGSSVPLSQMVFAALLTIGRGTPPAYTSCSGTLVSPSVVVTSATCLFDTLASPVTDVIVRLGMSDPSVSDASHGAETWRASDWRVHSKFSLPALGSGAPPEFDVGVVLLGPPGSAVAPASLDTGATAAPSSVGAAVAAIGYGTTHEAASTSSSSTTDTSVTTSSTDGGVAVASPPHVPRPVLRRVRLGLLDPELFCSPEIADNGTFLCAGVLSGGRGVCHADVGGPLMSLVAPAAGGGGGGSVGGGRNGASLPSTSHNSSSASSASYEWAMGTLVGWPSFGWGCAEPGTGAVFTRAAAFSDWLRAVSPPPPPPTSFSSSSSPVLAPPTFLPQLEPASGSTVCASAQHGANAVVSCGALPIASITSMQWGDATGLASCIAHRPAPLPQPQPPPPPSTAAASAAFSSLPPPPPPATLLSSASACCAGASSCSLPATDAFAGAPPPSPNPSAVWWLFVTAVCGGGGSGHGSGNDTSPSIPAGFAPSSASPSLLAPSPPAAAAAAAAASVAPGPTASGRVRPPHPPPARDGMSGGGCGPVRPFAPRAPPPAPLQPPPLLPAAAAAAAAAASSSLSATLVLSNVSSLSQADLSSLSAAVAAAALGPPNASSSAVVGVTAAAVDFTLSFVLSLTGLPPPPPPVLHPATTPPVLPSNIAAALAAGVARDVGIERERCSASAVPPELPAIASQQQPPPGAAPPPILVAVACAGFGPAGAAAAAAAASAAASAYFPPPPLSSPPPSSLPLSPPLPPPPPCATWACLVPRSVAAAPGLCVAGASPPPPPAGSSSSTAAVMTSAIASISFASPPLPPSSTSSASSAIAAALLSLSSSVADGSLASHLALSPLSSPSLAAATRVALLPATGNIVAPPSPSPSPSQSQSQSDPPPAVVLSRPGAGLLAPGTTRVGLTPAPAIRFVTSRAPSPASPLLSHNRRLLIVVALSSTVCFVGCAACCVAFKARARALAKAGADTAAREQRWGGDGTPKWAAEHYLYHPPPSHAQQQQQQLQQQQTTPPPMPRGRRGGAAGGGSVVHPLSPAAAAAAASADADRRWAVATARSPTRKGRTRAEQEQNKQNGQQHGGGRVPHAAARPPPGSASPVGPGLRSRGDNVAELIVNAAMD